MNTDIVITTALGMALPNAKNQSAGAEPVAVPIETLDADMDFARRNIYQSIESTANAIEELSEIARQGQESRQYEVLAQLLQRQTDAAEVLLKLHKAKKDAGGTVNTTTKSGVSTHVNNAVFVGTTAELLDLLKGKDHRIIEHDDMKE